MLEFLLSMDWKAWLLASQGLLGGALLVALLIPGKQPDKLLQSVLDFLKKFSLK